MNTELIRLSGVTARFGNTSVLENVNLSIGQGDFLGVVGPSGAGKTTLLNVILGLHRPADGVVIVNSRSLQQERKEKRIRVGYVPQLETVDWSFPATAGEIALMGTVGRNGIRPWLRRVDKQRMHDVFEQTGIGGLERRQIRDLSGGQRQRVFLARALLVDPELLVLDEATSGVDVSNRLGLLELVFDLNAGGTTVILATHDLNTIAAKLPRLACLNRKLIATGPTSEVFTAAVLSETFQNPMAVIDHHGAPMVVELPTELWHDHHVHIHDNHDAVRSS